MLAALFVGSRSLTGKFSWIKSMLMGHCCLNNIRYAAVQHFLKLDKQCQELKLILIVSSDIYRGGATAILDSAES